MSGHSNVLNKFLVISLGLWCTYYRLSVLQELLQCLRCCLHTWANLLSASFSWQSKASLNIFVHSRWRLGCGATAVQGLGQARWPMLNWKHPKLNKKYNSSHVCWSWQLLNWSIISWPFLVVVVEAALLQEMFSRLVSLNLLGNDEWATLQKSVQAPLCQRWDPAGRDRSWEGRGKLGCGGSIQSVGRRGRCWSAWTSVCVCSASLGPSCAAALRWARLGSAALGVHLALKIQDVMASRVWGKGGITNSCSQFSRGLYVGVEPEPVQSSSHSGKGKGSSRMLLFHLLAGNRTGLHFEYMFKNTLERAYCYCCYLFPCWLCLILYKQPCNFKGIS